MGVEAHPRSLQKWPERPRFAEKDKGARSGCQPNPTCFAPSSPPRPGLGGGVSALDGREEPNAACGWSSWTGRRGCGPRWHWSGRRSPRSAVGPISCGTSPTRCPRRKARACARPRPCIRPPAGTAAQGIFQRWARKWRPPRPRAVAGVERDLEELLAFYAFPAAHWRKIRTTNIIERAFREVRRRTRPMSSFTNPASCDRIVFGVISHLNRSWDRKPLKEFTQNA